MVSLADFGGPQFKPNEPGPGGHGQQGTLFSNRRLNAANRTGDEVGHRGYSPNRLAMVRDAVRVDVMAAGETPQISAALNGHYSAEERRTGRPEGLASRMERESIATDMTRDTVHQTIARSTVPESTIRRPMASGREKGTQVGVDYLGGKAGNYSPTGGNIMLHPAALDDSTPIHELGHQQDWHSHGAANAARQDPTVPIPGVRSGSADVQLGATPAKMATVEGFADAFADRHAVPHPHAKPESPADPGGGYSRYRDSDWAAYSNYAEDPVGYPNRMGVTSNRYAEARKEHGGLDLRPPTMQQLQFGRDKDTLPDVEDRKTWLRAQIPQ